MKAEGSCTPGGPLNATHVPIPVDPSLSGASPQPAPRPTPAPTPARKYVITSTRQRGVPLPQEVRDAIVAERTAGATATALATKYGLHRVTISAICREATR